MDWNEYRALDAVNWSSLKILADSPLHYRHALTSPRKDTPALARGRLVHCAVFEPAEVLRRYVLAPEVDRRTKDGKAAWAAALETAGDRELIAADDYDEAQRISEAVRAHPVAAEYLRAGVAETTQTWTDAETGLACKGRRDWISRSRPAVVDLKTARTIEDRQFRAAIARFGYNSQGAWYTDGEEAATGDRLPFVIIGVESSAPYDVGVFPIHSNVIAQGRDKYRRLLRTLATCRATNKWPGRYPEEYEIDELPLWATDIANDDVPDGPITF